MYMYILILKNSILIFFSWMNIFFFAGKRLIVVKKETCLNNAKLLELVLLLFIAIDLSHFSGAYDHKFVY